MIIERILDWLIKVFPPKIDYKSISAINPERITLEMVSNVLKVKPKRARDICESVFRQGYFGKNGDNTYYYIDNSLVI